MSGGALPRRAKRRAATEFERHAKEVAAAGVAPALKQALVVGWLALLLGEVDRRTCHASGQPESDATHTVMLEWVVGEIAVGLGCDPLLAMAFASVHELPETLAGDVCTARGLSAVQRAAKREAEGKAVAQIGRWLGGSVLLALHARYEEQRELEARLVKLVDKLLPRITHMINRGVALQKIGMTWAEMKAKHSTQLAELRAEFPEPELEPVHELMRLACEACERSLRGVL
jgi:putative hydrolase of HD superfamily